MARWAERQQQPKDKQASVESVQPEKQAQKEPTSENLPIALFPGHLEIADQKLPVYVLDNGKRVITQSEVVRVLTDGSTTGILGRYLDAHNLRPYIDKDSILEQAIRFKIPGTRLQGLGYEATLLLDMCDAYLRAREDGVLIRSQETLAKQAEIITRACAKVGIIALIDEATGYQEFRKKRDLQLKLQAFIAEDLQEWARMFPQESWFELARLEGVHYSPRSRPLRWGKYIMAFVYDAVDKDIGKELRKKNPNPHFGQNHHQWLKEFGRQKVHDQIERVATINEAVRQHGRVPAEIRPRVQEVRDRSTARVRLGDAMTDPVTLPVTLCSLRRSRHATDVRLAEDAQVGNERGHRRSDHPDPLAVSVLQSGERGRIPRPVGVGAQGASKNDPATRH